MKKYLAELIGTFFLVFTIGNVVLGGGAGGMAPLPIGLALMGMIFALGHVSGAHFNPAVSVAVMLRGKLPSKDLVPYVIAQIIGAVLAALAAKYLQGHGATSSSHPAVPALVAEILGTFALVTVILNVATTKANQGNSFYGLAIGMTVTAMAFAVGGVSGGAFNPAVAIGGAVMGLFSWGQIWIYLVGCVGGAALAAKVFAITSGDE